MQNLVHSKYFDALNFISCLSDRSLSANTPVNLMELSNSSQIIVTAHNPQWLRMLVESGSGNGMRSSRTLDDDGNLLCG